MSINKPRKSSLWLAPLGVIILPAIVVSYIAGFLWVWIFGGFAGGAGLATRLSGYESNQEMIKRVVRERAEGKWNTDK